MAGFDYDVLIIGSGFGGSVAALRAAEKGYRVGVGQSQDVRMIWLGSSSVCSRTP